MVAASSFTLTAADIGSTAPFTVTTTTLPTATQGAAYTQATGGTGPATWSVPTDTLPTGMTLASDGVLSGTPTTTGSTTFTVTAQRDGHTATQTLTLRVAVPPLTITTGTLPSATVGTAYRETLTASGGTGSDTWQVKSGTLPKGVTLSPGGVLSGTPTTAGPATFTVEVTDGASATEMQSLTLTVQAAVSPLTVTTTSLPTATVGTAYSQTIHASGGTGSDTWQVKSGRRRA